MSDALNDVVLARGPWAFDRPGEVAITVVVEDKIGGKKEAYRLPVVVHPPRPFAPGR